MSARTLHLFNPENDLALGLDCIHYTPPPHASALHRAGGLLPAWWASEGDAVLVADHSYMADAEWLSANWGLKCRPLTIATDDYLPSPWGWSLDAARQFADAGLPRHSLPSPDALAHYRQVSHRRSSIAILRALGFDDSDLPREFTDPDEAVKAELSSPGSYFKSPWSCSGRGVFCARGLSPHALRDRLRGIIHRQGSVLAEPGLNRLLDLAALFHADSSGAVTYRGLSIFTTDPSGNYGGNIVAPQETLREIIGSHGLLDSYDNLCRRLPSILADLTGGYSGWMGVDMLIHHDSASRPALHPCVELNLRSTMGMTAMAIADATGFTSPRLLAWQLSGKAEPGLLLLPPRSGFTLSLLPLSGSVSRYLSNSHL